MRPMDAGATGSCARSEDETRARNRDKVPKNRVIVVGIGSPIVTEQMDAASGASRDMHGIATNPSRPGPEWTRQADKRRGRLFRQRVTPVTATRSRSGSALRNR